MSCQHNLRWCHGSDLLQCAKCGYHCNQDSVTGMIIDLAMTCNNAKSHADACAARETLSAEMRAFQEAAQENKRRASVLEQCAKLTELANQESILAQAEQIKALRAFRESESLAAELWIKARRTAKWVDARTGRSTDSAAPNPPPVSQDLAPRTPSQADR